MLTISIYLLLSSIFLNQQLKKCKGARKGYALDIPAHPKIDPSSLDKVTTSKMFQATKSQSTFETLSLMVGKSLYVSVLNIDCKIDSGYLYLLMLLWDDRIDVNSFVRKAPNHYREPFL